MTATINLRKFFAAFFSSVLFVCTGLSSSAQVLDWASGFGSNGNDHSTSTSTDLQGNVFIGGGFTGTVDFDPSTNVSNRSSSGGTDIFLAKYTSTGQYLWAIKIGGTALDMLQSLVTDNSGNVYITGYFRGANVDFDPSPNTFFLSSRGDGGADPGYGGDIFVAKYSPDGGLVWAFNLGGSQLYDAGVSIGVDKAGNVYVGGYFREVVDFDPSASNADLDSRNGTIFLAKYNTGGQYQWAFNFGLGNADNTMFDLTVDEQGNVYTTGFFQGTSIDFDPSPATAYLSSAGGYEGYVAKYNSNGLYQFAFRLGGAGTDVGRGITLDNNGNIYVIGDFAGTGIDFDPGAGEMLLSSKGGTDVFLAKYTNAGQYQWAFNFGGNNNDNGWRVSTDGVHLFITGGFTGTADMNPSSAVDNLSSAGGHDIFLGKYNLEGEYLCAFNLGGGGDDYGNAIHCTSENSFYLTGTFTGSNINFNPQGSAATFTSNGGSDAFLARFSWPDNSPLSGTLTGGTVCKSGQATMTFVASGGTPPYSLVYSNGQENFSVENVQSGVPFNVLPSPTETTEYTLLSIKDAARCSESTRVSGITTTVTVEECSTCSNWLSVPNQPSYVRIGDLDVPGDHITVEASFIRTAPWTGSDLFQGDLVSKHEDPTDCNYLLRPSSAEITTTRGYFKTPVICPIELNKTYHAAMVYDGKTLKFYRNGFLMSEVAASGNLILNDWKTQIGLYFNQVTQENFIGFTNEVRIWNVARSQNQIRTYMDQSLPSPQTQSGLLAYYTFDNLANKQGNPTWNGTLGGSASINATNPACTFIADSCGSCTIPPFDFSFQQNTCSPKTVQFITGLPAGANFAWDFGDGNTDFSNQLPENTYYTYGTYPVKLRVQYNSACKDSITKTLTIQNDFDDVIISRIDTTICLGDSLMLRTSGLFCDSCWTSSNGGSLVSESGYIKPVRSATYTLNAHINGRNLVANGDFAAGNTGFSSDYTATSSNNSIGEYSIGADPGVWNSSFSSCGDHTTGTGNMLLLNGSGNPDSKVWSQIIPVSPNTDYSFSIWMSSLTNNVIGKVRLLINGAVVAQGVTADGGSCNWNKFATSWNSGNKTTALLTISDDNSTPGSSLAIDDIFFGQMLSRTDSVTVNVKGYCDSIKISGPNKVCSPRDTLSYNIYHSANCTQQFNVQVDNAFATVVEQTPEAVKLVFKREGNGIVRVRYLNDCYVVADSLEITVKFSPETVDLGADIVTCKDTTLLLDAGEGFSSYSWQDGSSSSTFFISRPGTYTVKAKNFCDAEFTGSMTLTKAEKAQFVVEPTNASVCKADSVLLTAGGGTSYSWTPVSNFADPYASASNAFVNASQDFSVHITDSVCKRDTILTVVVTALQQARISLSKSNDVNCGNDSAVLIAHGGVEYTWSPDLYITRKAGDRMTVKPLRSTTYVVFGRDQAGCVGEDSVTVFFSKEGYQKLFVPTAFSPNGDGLNDLFRPIFIGPAANYDFRVYNRWGQLVYRSRTPGAGWDGRFQGISQKPDVYVFYLTAEGDCNGKFEKKGTFVLIR